MVKAAKSEETKIKESINKALKSTEAMTLIEELKKDAPPLEILASEQIEEIQKNGQILAAKAEAYYLGYLKGVRIPGGEVADAGVTIVAATTGSVVGTVVGQIVGKKLDSAVNIREQIINPEMFQIKGFKG